MDSFWPTVLGGFLAAGTGVGLWFISELGKTRNLKKSLRAEIKAILHGAKNRDYTGGVAKTISDIKANPTKAVKFYGEITNQFFSVYLNSTSEIGRLGDASPIVIRFYHECFSTMANISTLEKLWNEVARGTVTVENYNQAATYILEDLSRCIAEVLKLGPEAETSLS